jgi:methylmalonyl-CoA/ethylmalonyl-CoA epimerase
MTSLGNIGQIAVSVNDTDAAEQFYCGTLGLPKLFRYGSLLFIDCAGVRLMIEGSATGADFTPASSCIYFRSDSLTADYPALKDKGVDFVDEPHLIAPMPDHDLWMVFFKDPAGNLLSLMQEAPKGHTVWPA